MATANEEVRNTGFLCCYPVMTYLRILVKFLRLPEPEEMVSVFYTVGLWTDLETQKAHGIAYVTYVSSSYWLIAANPSFLPYLFQSFLIRFSPVA